MERSGQGASNPVCTARPVAPRLGVVITGAVLLGGCHAFTLPDRQDLPSGGASYSALRPVVLDETLAARAKLSAAEAAEARRQEQCVALYCQATILAWQQMELGDRAAFQIYQEGLSHLLSAASRYGRLDPRGRLTIGTKYGCRDVPISYYGFAWQPGDFCQVLPATDFDRGHVRDYYYTPGVGTSLVAVRQAACDEEFLHDRQTFPVTAVLRPTESGAVLEFYNPLIFDSVSVGPATLPLDRDLSASLVYLKETAPRKYLQGFFDPGETGLKPKLVMMEPYQRGKVPVVFIHGLGSDPLTWTDATNSLRAQEDLYRCCQLWYFRYPTGGDLMESAAALRDKLLLARETCDPQHSDPALAQMVLVGHSLGGIVAQLQVTYSSDILWRHAAKQPIEAVRALPQTREGLQRKLFFDPSPLVKRVVFMATPHRGSNMARRFIGRAASKFVHYSAEDVAAYRQLMDSNRHIFFEYLWRAKPTAIDMIEPDNPLLDALAQMPFSRCVRVHSIIGTAVTTLRGEPSDGVVPVSSARQPGACSERFVSAWHEQVNKADESLAELRRILREHILASTIRLEAQAAAIGRAAPVMNAL